MPLGTIPPSTSKELFSLFPRLTDNRKRAARQTGLKVSRVLPDSGAARRGFSRIPSCGRTRLASPFGLASRPAYLRRAVRRFPPSSMTRYAAAGGARLARSGSTNLVCLSTLFLTNLVIIFSQKKPHTCGIFVQVRT